MLVSVEPSEIEREVRARLEVASLYEAMPGQASKAARYYFAAAERFRTAGRMDQARMHYRKVIALEPGHRAAGILLEREDASGCSPDAVLPQRPHRVRFVDSGTSLGDAIRKKLKGDDGPPGDAGVPAHLPPKPPSGASGSQGLPPV
jgi:hypothetical protein